MHEQKNPYLYFDIPKQERESAIAFLLDAILKSRMACRIPSNQRQFDEDVNIYLAHLLFVASLPDYQNAIQQYLSTNVSEMADLMEKTGDRIVRYFIYKVNADHLMVHLGIFRDLERERNPFGKSERQFSSMAEDYYRQAASYNRQIYRRQTAVGSVLEKLADGFEGYQRILHFTRREFFHFSNRFREDSFQKFLDDMGRYEHKENLERAMNRFLDGYADWLQTRDPEALNKLRAYARELEALDPSFSFHLGLGRDGS